MNVMHLSPTFFGDQSVVGGGERYAWELARACAARTPTTFVSFAPASESRDEGALHVRLLASRANRRSPLEGNPFHPGLYAEIARADVIHCHQADTFSTNAAIVAGRVLGRKVFVSDLGGGHVNAPSLRLPILPRATGMLLLSQYSKARWDTEPASRRPKRAEVVYGGVGARFAPAGDHDAHHVLYVGRIVRHKGIEHAIDAIDAPFRLTVAGRPYDPEYAAMLRDRARGRSVDFREDVDDAGLPVLYSSALATVMPSTYDSWGGVHTDVPELLGLVALESMACGTPAIVSRVASLPELVEDGVTGFIVAPNDPAAIRDALGKLAASPALRQQMGRAARAAVLARFTWERTAQRCLEAYRR